MLQIIQTSDDDLCTGGLYLKCVHVCVRLGGEAGRELNQIQ